MKTFQHITIPFLGVTCFSLNSIENGRLDLSDEFFVGSMATYSCDEGYEIVGILTQTCQTSRQWTSSQPYCRSMCVLIPMFVLLCCF